MKPRSLRFTVIVASVGVLVLTHARGNEPIERV